MPNTSNIDKAAESLARIGATGAPKRDEATNAKPTKLLVIVENQSYASSIYLLIKKCDIQTQDITIRCSASDDEVSLLRELRLNTQSTTAYTHILCIADGEDNPRGQFKSIIDALGEVEYKVSNVAWKQDGVKVSDKYMPTIGIWVMPNNKDIGTFADFYLHSALVDNKLMQNIDNVLVQNKKDKLVKFKKSYHGAAKFFTYLAWQKNPARSDETLFQMDKFNYKNQLFISFRNWLSNVLSNE